jgi:hypothetical protein
MKSDMRALLKLFAASALVAVIVLGILVAAALELLTKEVAVAAALVVMVGGAIILGVVFRRGLLTQIPSGKPYESNDENFE